MVLIRAPHVFYVIFPAETQNHVFTVLAITQRKEHFQSICMCDFYTPHKVFVCNDLPV